jgi:ectoine hydroxylase-related dioxygenase (phytanoyl-CoA dioxygenase family)
MQAVPCHLKAGDVLFFNGSVIHGSYPNTSSTRFRRAFICHYVPESMTQMSGGYYPLHTFAGETLEREVANGGGVCGTESGTRCEKRAAPANICRKSKKQRRYDETSAA